MKAASSENSTLLSIISLFREGTLVLKTNKTVNENRIYCFTDSVWYYLYKVNVTYDRHMDLYVLQPKEDGYYWCVHVDSRNYLVSESNKALFIRMKDSLVNSYAIKLRVNKAHNFNYFDYNSNMDNDDDLNYQNITEAVLQFLEDKDMTLQTRIKRQYIDEKTTLVHVSVKPNMNPQSAGIWGNFIVQSVNPVYYCPAFGVVDSSPIGKLL